MFEKSKDYLSLPKNIGLMAAARLGEAAAGSLFFTLNTSAKLGSKVLRTVDIRLPIEERARGRGEYEMKLIEEEIAARAEAFKAKPALADTLAYRWVSLVKRQEAVAGKNPKKPTHELIQDAAFILLQNEVDPKTVEVAVHKLYEQTGMAEVVKQAVDIEQPTLHSMTQFPEE